MRRSAYLIRQSSFYSSLCIYSFNTESLQMAAYFIIVSIIFWNLVPIFGSVVVSDQTKNRLDCDMSPLHSAVKDGNRTFVESLLASGADKYAEDCDGLTPMHAATSKPHMIDLLVERAGFDVNRRFEGGNTTLMYAVLVGSLEAVWNLLQVGSIAHLENDIGSTPFLEALYSNNDAMVDAFVEGGANVGVRLSDGDTYLHKVAESGNFRAARRIIRLWKTPTKDKSLDVKNSKDETPLTIAVRRNDVALANLFLSKGADIWTQSLNGQTYLHVAVLSGSLDCIRNLVELGLTPDTTNSESQTPLSLAVKKDDLDSVRVLASLEADLRQLVFDSFNLLHLAAHEGSLKSIGWLASKGLPLDAKDRYDNTPLHYAVGQDRYSSVLSLLELGAQVNPINMYKMTPMAAARQHGFNQIVKLLRARGGVE